MTFKHLIVTLTSKPPAHVIRSSLSRWIQCFVFVIYISWVSNTTAYVMSTRFQTTRTHRRHIQNNSIMFESHFWNSREFLDKATFSSWTWPIFLKLDLEEFIQVFEVFSWFFLFKTNFKHDYRSLFKVFTRVHPRFIFYKFYPARALELQIWSHIARKHIRAHYRMLFELPSSSSFFLPSFRALIIKIPWRQVTLKKTTKNRVKNTQL